MVSESTFTVRGHGAHTAFEESLAAVRSMKGVRLVSGVRAIRPRVILHAHTIGPVVLAQLLAHRGRKVVTAHVTPPSFVGSIRGAAALLPLIKRYLRSAYNRADVVVAVSHTAAEELVELGVRVPIVTIYNAIDGQRLKALRHARADIRSRLGWDDRFTVLAVGQLQPRKGVDEFVACAHALPRYRFVWVGGMPFGLLSAERSRLLKMLGAAPPNCHLTGLIAREDVFNYYAAADVFFLPSKHETFGLAVLEAANASLPLVLPRLACYNEWLRNAFLPVSSEEEQVKALESLAASVELRSQMSSRALRVAAEFGLPRLADGLRTAYILANAGALPTSPAQSLRSDVDLRGLP